MNEAVPDCLVTGYELLKKGLDLPDPDYRHVLAAAIRVRAEVIVTFNLKDFPPDVLEEFDIFTQNSDDFIDDLFDLSPQTVITVARQQRASPRLYARRFPCQASSKSTDHAHGPTRWRRWEYAAFMIYALPTRVIATSNSPATPRPPSLARDWPTEKRTFPPAKLFPLSWGMAGSMLWRLMLAVRGFLVPTLPRGNAYLCHHSQQTSTRPVSTK